jgi:hypothetical protein
MQSSAVAQQDPTRPPNVMAQQLAPLQQKDTGFLLTAIFKRSQQHYAVVNGEVVQKGDKILGMQVSDIDAVNVTLTDTVSSANDIVLTVKSESGLSKRVVK